MSAPITPDSFDKRFEKPARPTARFGLRSQIERRPLIMFATVVTSAFLAMAFHPTAGSALASAKRAEQHKVMIAELSEKGPRLRTVSEVDAACDGQSWGAESEGCLKMIAKESGRDDTRRVRLIASIGTEQPMTPNVF
jgi:hypothetical protein